MFIYNTTHTAKLMPQQPAAATAQVVCSLAHVSLLVSMITLRYMWIWIVVVFGFEPGTGHCQNWPTKLFACLSNFL